LAFDEKRQFSDWNSKEVFRWTVFKQIFNVEVLRWEFLKISNMEVLLWEFLKKFVNMEVLENLQCGCSSMEVIKEVRQCGSSLRGFCRKFSEGSLLKILQCEIPPMEVLKNLKCGSSPVEVLKEIRQCGIFSRGFCRNFSDGSLLKIPRCESSPMEVFKEILQYGSSKKILQYGSFSIGFCRSSYLEVLRQVSFPRRKFSNTEVFGRGKLALGVLIQMPHVELMSFNALKFCDAEAI